MVVSCFISISNFVSLVYGKEKFSNLAPDSAPCVSRFPSHEDQDVAEDDRNPHVVLTGRQGAAGSSAQLQELGSGLKPNILDGAAGNDY